MATLRQLGHNICTESLLDDFHQYIYFWEHFTAVLVGIQEAVSVDRNEHSIYCFFNLRNISQILIAKSNGSQNDVHIA